MHYAISYLIWVSILIGKPPLDFQKYFCVTISWLQQFVHCFSPLRVFLRQSFSLGNDPNGNVTLPVPNMAGGRAGTALFSRSWQSFRSSRDFRFLFCRAKSDGISRPNGLSFVLPKIRFSIFALSIVRPKYALY